MCSRCWWSPKFGRFDYRQKFEYWGLIFGSIVMVVTGFILIYPITVANLLPAELIPAAKVMNSYEALLALLIVLVWHIVGAHLAAESFPMDTSICTRQHLLSLLLVVPMVTAAAVFVGLRGVHVVVPTVFPETRRGPVAIARLEDVKRQVGFAPIVPAYRPEILGDHPGDMTIRFSPVPTFRTVWRGAQHDLTLTQQRGGPGPVIPPLARPLDDVPDAFWWTAGGRSYLVVRREQFWIELDTSLPPRELRRFADTLTTYSPS